MIKNIIFDFGGVIDDNFKNITTAKSLGFEVVHIKTETDLGEELGKLGVEF